MAGVTSSGITAKQAARTAEEYATGAIELLTLARSNPPIGRMADLIRIGIYQDPAVFLPERDRMIAMFGHQAVDTIHQAVMVDEMVRRWQRHRVVYRVHPELAARLSETDPRTTIPCEVFARLPHPDPFVVFPTRIPAPKSADKSFIEPPMFTGMLVTGYTEDRRPCSSADPEVAELSIALTAVMQYEGLDRSYEEYTLQVPTRARLTIEEMINDQRGDILLGSAGWGEDRHAYGLAVSLLLYLCSDNRDVSQASSPEPKRKTRSRNKLAGRATIIDVGFDVGPKLFAARRDTTYSTSTAELGRSVRSHLRRAHWHTYLTGPRDQPTPVVRWIHPVLVNANQRTTRPTVIDTGSPG
ncbi:hypothetical protein [Nocardia sp. NPDC057030]|uniref:hypothetical protein n=1 Tax=unclassified Nocardia TaxID=2637762 RepID=UPI00362EFEA2